MEIEYDEEKRQAVLNERGVDIVYAAGIFEGETLIRIDDRADYGEPRYIALGMVENECFVVVYTERGDKLRLITAWKGGRSERSQYENSIGRRSETDEGNG